MNYLVAYQTDNSGMGRCACQLLQMCVYDKVLGDKKNLVEYRKASDILPYVPEKNERIFDKTGDHDIVHFPYNMVSRRVKKGIIVVTIHDLNPIRVRVFGFKRWCKYLLETRYAVRRADYIITVSENSKKDIMQFFGVKSEKIKVIYNGWDSYFCQLPTGHQELIDIRTKYKLDERYDIIMTQGNAYAHKNVPRTVEAFAKLNRDNCLLVIVGGIDKQKKKIMQAIKKARVEDKVIITGRISDCEMRAWYNLADVFVFVSLCEGFGIPPLEAMACGTPVITTSGSCLPEIVGDAALKVHPKKTEEIAHAMERVLDHPKLQKQMRQRGEERVKLFSWEKFRKETEQFIQELIAKER